MTKPAKNNLDQKALYDRLQQMEQTLQSLEAELDRTSRQATLGVLAAMIAHEFNNILTPIMNYSMLALADIENRQLVTKALERNVEGAKRLTRISSAILGFLNEKDQAHVADIKSTLDETIDCMANQPKKAGVKVIPVITPGLAVDIQPVCLQQVLLNLILNALQAMESSRGEIRITASADANQNVEILVADTGHGIPAEMIDRIFEPLVSSQRRTVSKQTNPDKESSGHGLGLAVCRRLIEDAGGTISVQSNQGQGTVFVITLKQVCNPSLRKSA